MGLMPGLGLLTKPERDRRIRYAGRLNFEWVQHHSRRRNASVSPARKRPKERGVVTGFAIRKCLPGRPSLQRFRAGGDEVIGEMFGSDRSSIVECQKRKVRSFRCGKSHPLALTSQLETK